MYREIAETMLRWALDYRCHNNISSIDILVDMDKRKC